LPEQNIYMKTNFEIFDEYWEYHLELGGMTLPYQMIPPQMKDHSRKSNHDGISCWKLIPSTITNEELTELEEAYRNPLPNSFKNFLQYKHYIQFTNVGTFSLDFFNNEPKTRFDEWIPSLKSEFEPFINHKYLVIGTFQDLTGVLCFDGSKEVENNEYPLVLIDFAFEAIEPLADNFYSFFQDLAKQMDKWRRTV